MTWHPSSDQLVAYRDGGSSATQAWSIESHVAACPDCRGTVDVTDPDRLETIWEAALDEIDAPHLRLIERGLTAVGVPEHLARLLGATPSLTLPWLVAVFAVLGFGLAMVWNSSTGLHGFRQGLFLFLLVAPVVPVVGVAAAFGPAMDPAHEVAVASPFHGFRLLMIRTVAVVASSMTVALGLSLFLPDAGLMAAAWILPGLALPAVTLAASTFVTPLVAAGGATVLWLVGVTAAEAGPSVLVAFRWTGQLVFALVLVTAIAVVTVRRDRFEVAE